MNRAVVLFLEKVEQVNKLVETGITVGRQFVQVTPVTQPVVRITLSNVPPVISDEFLVRELSRHGKVVFPIRKMLLGCKSPLLRHVVSNRRQVHMILNNRAEEFNYRFIVQVDDFDSTLFATSSALKCFNCGEEGHLARVCQSRVVLDAPAAEPAFCRSHGAGAFRRRGVGGSVQREDGAVAESHTEEKRGECVSETEVSGGSENVEMVVEMNGKSGIVAGKLGEGGVRTGERGEGAVGTGEGTVSAGEGTSGASEWWLVPVKRRNKQKSAMKDKGGKTGRLEDPAAGTDTSDCESMSDCGELSGTETHSDCGIEADWEKEWGFTPSSLEVEHVVRGRCFLVKVRLQNHSLKRLWWDRGKLEIQLLCQQYTLNATQDTRRSIKDLETEIVELEAIGSSTGDRGAGQELVELGQIRKRAVEFFSSLYESEYCRDDGLFDEFCEDLPRVSEETNSRLDRPLQLDELQAALLSMKGRKSPGVDGLTVEFFKAFWGIVAHDWLEVFNESVASGFLPLSCSRAVVTLLPKKGNLQEIKNWHPVSLLCMDYRILSKTLASRLREAMEQVIHQDQTYCVPGRSIVDNVHLIRDVLEVSRSLDVDTGLISLDQEKAFDRVEHEFLWKVMERFGFSPGFIAMIRILYCDIVSMLKFNGSLCAPFKVRRGVIK
ncbi:Transposon TX1 uncharacterized 149 kDa protein ORF 2 [Takifugu flavidus]|uniref:Transposon TX1 uncharacterized 149 kDa protein ORF 2 n=1 Tax=Takifugu flavidus TaxID=433684 RepID=A0A5C6N2R8_9TELE|nr:Transposon TX1 uncharacterized 149 kDa protein ORF 2 [Takifugu flavidus]